MKNYNSDSKEIERKREREKDWFKKQEKGTKKQINKKIIILILRKKEEGKPGPISTITEADASEHFMISRQPMLVLRGEVHCAGSHSDLS